jgi:hypothetical protein
MGLGFGLAFYSLFACLFLAKGFLCDALGANHPESLAVGPFEFFLLAKDSLNYLRGNYYLNHHHH